MSSTSPPPGPDPHRLQGLPPVIGPGARVLVLGSMPGGESLRRAQYYAHPRNDFWRIVENVFGAARDASYDARLQSLVDQGIALWDVLGECRRKGSLDADIDPASMRTNDIAGLLASAPGIGHIAFNGALAEKVFRQRIAWNDRADITMARLPSTSPANASLRFDDKLAAWAPSLRWSR